MTRLTGVTTLRRVDSVTSARSRTPSKLLSTLCAAAPLVLAAASCSGPPISSSVDGEPVCADYEIGALRRKMQGSLRYPIMLTILDGSTPVLKAMVLGRRAEGDPHTRVVLSDATEEYTVQWAQCENERASRPADGSAGTSKEAASYECGDAKVYATEKLTTRKGDPRSHVVKFMAPPKAECWTSDVPIETPDAGAPDASPQASGDDASAGDAGDTDAGAEDAGTDAAAVDAGGAADAGGADAGSDAGADAKKKKSAGK